jgi:hypothetical protein
VRDERTGSHVRSAAGPRPERVRGTVFVEACHLASFSNAEPGGGVPGERSVAQPDPAEVPVVPPDEVAVRLEQRDGIAVRFEYPAGAVEREPKIAVDGDAAIGREEVEAAIPPRPSALEGEVRSWRAPPLRPRPLRGTGIETYPEHSNGPGSSPCLGGRS